MTSVTAVTSHHSLRDEAKAPPSGCSFNIHLICPILLSSFSIMSFLTDCFLDTFLSINHQRTGKNGHHNFSKNQSEVIICLEKSCNMYNSGGIKKMKVLNLESIEFIAIPLKMTVNQLLKWLLINFLSSPHIDLSL